MWHQTPKLLLWVTLGAVCAWGARPNIVVIMTDDQDLYYNSLDHMPIVQKELTDKGTFFKNHWATTAQCCPSRSSFLRGQMVHNTNITNVGSPGGNYDKWLASKQDEDYLPHWLRGAGYAADYMGKLLNGLNLGNYDPAPKGWSNIDALLDPYMYDYVRIVMSDTGARPESYVGWHQLDIMRIKAVQHIKDLAKNSTVPFFYMIAPTAPHNIPGRGNPIPQQRHADAFADLEVPKSKNFNPGDEYAAQKVSWVGELPALNDTQVENANKLFRARLRTLQGVDELVEDVVATLEAQGLLDNTYIVYTTDNGYGMGFHRIAAGKCLAYREATNLPLIVRGPGVPAGVESRIPGTHFDLAPTFLDIAGVSQEDMPPQLDGRSLLNQWHNPLGSSNASISPFSPSTRTVDTSTSSREIINIEFWGHSVVELPSAIDDPISTYKSLRIVGEDFAYLYVRWCTNEVELYNTIDDPEELTNLAINATADSERLMTRLNTLLLILKSCEGGACQNPWQYLKPELSPTSGNSSGAAEPAIASLRRALDPQYDDYFAGFGTVHFDACLVVQRVDNEQPFYPANASQGLGSQWRARVDFYDDATYNITGHEVERSPGAGTAAQRNATYAQLMADSKELTDAQIGAS